MTFTVGIVKPSNRPGRGEDLDPILPPGIHLIANHLNIYSGTPEEVKQAIVQYDDKVKELAHAGAHVVHPAGVPPLLLGYAGEQRRIAEWEAQAGVPVFTNGSSQMNALRAFGTRRIVGLSYFPADLQGAFARYCTEAGFEVLAMRGLEVPFQEVIKLPPATVDAFVRTEFRKHPSADALYLIGPAWRTMELVPGWERDFGVPVVHHVMAQSWEMQRLLRLRHPVAGYGRLVAELPGLPG